MIVRGEAGDRYPWQPLTLAQQLALTAAAHPDRDALVVRRPAALVGRDAARGAARRPRVAGRGGGEGRPRGGVGPQPHRVDPAVAGRELDRRGDRGRQHALQDRGGRLHPASVRREAAGDGRGVRGHRLPRDARPAARGGPAGAARRARDRHTGVGRVPRRAGQRDRRRRDRLRRPELHRLHQWHHRLPEGRGALQPRPAQRVLDLRGDGHRRLQPRDEPHAVLPHRRRVHGRAAAADHRRRDDPDGALGPGRGLPPDRARARHRPERHPDPLHRPAQPRRARHRRCQLAEDRLDRRGQQPARGHPGDRRPARDEGHPPGLRHDRDDLDHHDPEARRPARGDRLRPRASRSRTSS